MRGRLSIFRVCAILSFTFLTATAILWIQSYFQSDALTAWYAPPPDGAKHVMPLVLMETYRGSFSIGRGTTQFDTKITGYLNGWNCWWPAPRRGFYFFPDNPNLVWHVLGFWYWYFPSPIGGPGWRFNGPFWFPCVMFALSPGRMLVGAIRRRRSQAAGLCPACGYDLRSSPDRCPECGRAVEPVKV